MRQRWTLHIERRSRDRILLHIVSKSSMVAGCLLRRIRRRAVPGAVSGLWPADTADSRHVKGTSPRRLRAVHCGYELIEEVHEGGVIGFVDVVDVPQAGLAYLGPLGV